MITNFTYNTKYPSLAVLARSNGDVWASFVSSPKRMGLYRDGAWTVFDGEPFILDYAEATDGTLYGVGAFGAYRLNEATNQWQQIGPFGASQIAVDPVSEFLYIQDELNSVKRFNGTSWSTFATFPGWVGGIGVGPDGDVWIAAEAWPTHDDLHQYSSSGQMLRIYNRSNTGMLDYFQPGMYLDRDGMMWFTDVEYGASRLEPNDNWRNFGIYNGQEEVHPFWTFPVGMPWWQTPGADFWTESPNQVYHDMQGNFWFRGANIIARSAGSDLAQWTIWEPGQSGFPWQCDSMGEDAQGNIWVGDAYGLYRLEGSTWVDVSIGIPGQFAPVGLEQGDDGELYAVRVASVFHVAGSTITPMMSIPDGFGIITDLEVDASGHFWIGTPNGMFHWNGATSTLYTPANSAMSDLTVVDITIRPGDGLVAVATSQQEIPPYTGGVALFDRASGEWIGYDHGSSFMPFYAPGDLQFDADGHLWIGVLNFGAVHLLIGDEGPGVLGDADGNGVVNVADLIAVITAWGACPGSCPPGCPADLDGDCMVGVTDLVLVVSNWS
jgi:hypothetical protein